jgi:hypothetical protein
MGGPPSGLCREPGCSLRSRVAHEPAAESEEKQSRGWNKEFHVLPAPVVWAHNLEFDERDLPEWIHVVPRIGGLKSSNDPKTRR